MNNETRNGIRIVYNDMMPLPGFAAIMLFGTIFARRKYAPLTDDTVRHGNIHLQQAKECGGWMRYYIKYVCLWLRYGYRNNPMEREAFRYMFDKTYMATREKTAWKKYIA